MERGFEIKVLDHGHVRLIDYMGSDEAVIEAARMSTGKGFVAWEPYYCCRSCSTTMIFDSEIKNKMIRLTGVWQDHNHDWEHISRGDAGLLEYLYSNKHMTPFECGGELMIEVQAPIMVFREWHRHRTFAFNEFSARYSKMLNLHYVPDTSRIQKQSSINKQGSELQAMEFADDIRGELEDEQQQIYSRYDRIVEQGVAREVARLNTPVSRYSKMRAKTDLRNWLAFLQLRMASNAQWEIRQYANAVAEIVKSIYPRTYALFEEHTLHGVSLSRSEIEQLRRALDSDEVSTKLATKLGIE